MEIVSTGWHVIIAFLLFIGGALVSILLSRTFGLHVLRALTIYCWHTVFCCFYLWYVMQYGGDAIAYYERAQVSSFDFSVGTVAVYYLTAFPVNVLGASILGAFLFYNIFGSIGLLAFDGALRLGTQDAKPYVKKIASVIIFLPSVSFWSSAIGKDSLAFMAAGVALWAAINLDKRALWLGFAIFVMLLVRPHIAGLMVMSLAFAAIFDAKAKLTKRIVYSFAAVVITAMLVPFALKYAGVGEAVNFEVLNTYIEKRQSYNLEGDGGIEIGDMSLPMQLFTYMFRPSFLDVNSLFSLAAAVDNALILYLFIVGCWSWFKYRVNGVGNRLFMWSYSIMAWGILAMTTANLGIALRQKWMFAPMLIFLLISVIGKKKSCSTFVASDQSLREKG